MNKKYIVDTLVKERGIRTFFDDELTTQATRCSQTHAFDSAAGATNLGEVSDVCDAGHHSADKVFIDKKFITVDDETAHDFDDAIFCEKINPNTFLLYVAISDVSRYIEKNSGLDKEARKRGNSVYLPDRVYPMLPPVISNQSCSLQPQQQRYAVVCEMRIEYGDVVQYQFYRSVMTSDARWTYDQLDETLNNDDNANNNTLAKNLATVGKLLQQARINNGSMVIQRCEKSCRLEKEKLIIQERKPSQARWIVEEAMIATNQCAADFLSKHKVPALYRVHVPPSPEKIKALQTVLSDIKLSVGKLEQASDFAALIAKIEKQNPELVDVLLPAILGTLSRATYTPENKGHYGLGASNYLHFTSPIRRYPDLINHRQLLAVLNNDKSNIYQTQELWEIGQHCSETEVVADKLEWDSRHRLLCTQVRNLVGCTFQGYVSGVGKFGLFVAIPQISIDGMIRLASMSGYWEQVDDKPMLQRRGDGTKLGLGAPITVELLSVRPECGRVDLKAIENFN